MADDVFRKELNLIRKWRAQVRRGAPKGFEDRAYADCANELERMIQESLVNPLEKEWVERLLNVSKADITDDQKRANFRSIILSFHWMWISGEYYVEREDDKWAEARRGGPTVPESLR
jgi:hypothetical protein